jgi:hypothetical protein
MSALPPIALGHVLAVRVVVAIVAGARVVLPLDMLEAVIAVTLITLGLYRLWRHRHPRFGGMQVSVRDLTVWSFLMAFAHGAVLFGRHTELPRQRSAICSNEIALLRHP